MTVVQLKEALKSKGLATDGKKADLIARLTEAMAGSGELDDEDDKKEKEALPQASPLSALQHEESKNSIETAQSVDEEPVADKKPMKKVLTPEERKQLAVDLLTKKIKRAEKFGDDAAATSAKKDLARVEKFGVDPSTALAKEIGALDRDVNTELSNKKFRKSRRRKGKNSGRK